MTPVRRGARKAESNIKEAARRIQHYFLVLNQGMLPKTDLDWRHFTESCHVYSCPIECVQESYTARLIYDERLRDGWLIAYNAKGSPEQVCRWIAHEMAEYFALCDSPSLFDDLPQRVYYYTGGTDPDDARHRIARRVEEICFRGLKR